MNERHTHHDVYQAFLFSLEWLPDMRDLVSVCLSNKTLLSLVLDTDHLWTRFRVYQAVLHAIKWLPDMDDLVSVALTNKTLLSVVLDAPKELWDRFRCAICNQPHQQPFLICKICEGRFCDECQKTGRMIVPFYCDLCFTTVCDDCLTMCDVCNSSWCNECHECGDHVCD
jgi:hypothetical protein